MPDDIKLLLSPDGFSLTDLRHPENVTLACELSHIAYYDDEDTRDIFERHNLNSDDVYVISTKLVHVFIFKYEELFFVSFRGSSSFSQWWNNLDVRFQRTSIGLVHKGFFRSLFPTPYALIRGYLEESGARRPGAKIVLIGHSRGGALAMLTAGFLILENIIPFAVYTVGAPKVGDGSFAAWMEMAEKSYGLGICNVVFGSDVVPKLPPSDMSGWLVVAMLPLMGISMLWDAFLQYVRRRFTARL